MTRGQNCHGDTPCRSRLLKGGVHPPTTTGMDAGYREARPSPPVLRENGLNTGYFTNVTGRCTTREGDPQGGVSRNAGTAAVPCWPAIRELAAV